MIFWFYENSYFQSIQIPCFCIFFAKNSDFNTKAKKLASLQKNLDLTHRSTTLTLNSTKTCEKAGKRKISVLETHYFLLKLYKKVYYVKSRFVRSLFFTILTILRLFSKISSPNTGCWDSSHPQWATLFLRLSAKNAANRISLRGVRRITA